MADPAAPDEPPDKLKQIAWASFITFAVNDTDLRMAFTAATGVAFTFKVEPGTARSVIDEELKARVTHFIEWVTREHYGLEHAPKAYRDSLEKPA